MTLRATTEGMHSQERTSVNLRSLQAAQANKMNAKVARQWSSLAKLSKKLEVKNSREMISVARSGYGINSTQLNSVI